MLSRPWRRWQGMPRLRCLFKHHLTSPDISWHDMIYDMIWCDMMLYHGHHQGTSVNMCFLTKPLREALVFAASKSSHGNLKIIKLEIQKKNSSMKPPKVLGFPAIIPYHLSVYIHPLFLEDFVASLFCLVGTLGEGPGIRRQHLTCWEAVWRPIVQGVLPGLRSTKKPLRITCVYKYIVCILGPNVQILAYKNQCVL